MQSHKSICSYCGVGCGVAVSHKPDGRLDIRGDETHPTNRGMLCSKGRYLQHVVKDQSDRLTHPQMRKSRAHPLEQVSWDTSLGRCAKTFQTLIDRFGPRSVGFYVSGQLLTEEYYIANKLVKGFIGGNNIDTNSRLCMSSAVAGYKKALGDDAVPISYDDIELSDCMLIAGANPAWCHPILFRRIEQRKAAAPDTRIIVVDPRRTATASIADIHLQIQPGTDVTLYNALARCLIDNDWIDTGYIQRHVDGFDDLCRTVRETSIEDAAEICHIPAEDIYKAAAAIGSAKAFMTFWAMGLNQSAVGVDKNLALLNLSLITGQIGKPGAGPFSLTGQPNAMGGREVGGLANLLAAHHDLANPEHRTKVADFWSVDSIDAEPGLTATEMFDALADDQLKAIWIVCTNPAVSMPDAERIERALKKARFVVVQDISSRSDTARFADVLLPAAGWLEKEGTMTNSERRVSYLPKVVEPPGEALPDADILCRFAQRMGWGEAFSYESASEIFDEHCALTRGTSIDMSGMSHQRLRDEGGLQWPCPSDDHPGTERLFTDGRFPTKSTRAQVHAITPENRSEAPSETYPLILTTGRIRDQWHTKTRTGKVGRLNQVDAMPFLEMHPDDAQQADLQEGDCAVVRNERGEVRAEVRITDTIKRGVVFLPMHHGRGSNDTTGCANNITSPRVDPVSKEPDFKFATVSVNPSRPDPRRVLVIGAGAASLAFVERYCALRPEDEVHVFGAERDLFYQRPLLPDLVARRRDWPSLKATPSSGENLHLHAGVRIDRIDRDRREIVDTEGNTYDYSALVIATGSRPSVPQVLQVPAEGIFTIRDRIDAEHIRDLAQPGRKAVVVGGGLLGIEMADALSARGMECTLFHRSSSLMRDVLDSTSENILRRHLERLGIQVRVNETVLGVHANPNLSGVRTTSGAYIECDMLVCATGITPNVELAQAASLAVRRGVVVDATLRTSDPGIYAVGEVAEFESRLYGTTPSAQEQARVAAEHLAGRTYARYRSSVPYNILKVTGLRIATVGEIHTGADDAETVSVLDEARLLYRKCIIQQDRLKGAVLVGDLSPLDQYRQWIADDIELESERDSLARLGEASASEPPIGPIVCSCYSVGRGNIEGMLDEGATSLEEICDVSRAGTGCGSCRPEIEAQLRARIGRNCEAPKAVTV